ncbi:hypothetical protein KQX54_018616 [Cotesia glomerata]|uniref:Uncharacterized protein n=1 Tax=Cotesia glomerata TaxID=32391 RepID=A0AAV7ID71_COTGL|nr:hypothetical protein KQX54_018616 [Cotesia glomerata]
MQTQLPISSCFDKGKKAARQDEREIIRGLLAPPDKYVLGDKAITVLGPLGSLGSWKPILEPTKKDVWHARRGLANKLLCIGTNSTSLSFIDRLTVEPR